MAEVSLPARQPTKSRGRGWLAFVLKASVTLALIWWLQQSGALDMSRVGILLKSQQVFVVTALNWLCITVALSSFRWWLLLRGVDQHISFGRAVALQTMALFFNAVVPGNIGGDLLKNHAVLGRKSGRLLVLVLVERTVGLIALVWVAGIGLVLSLERLGESPQFSALLYFIALLIVGSIVAPWVLLRLRLDEKVRRMLAEPSRSGLLGSLKGTFLRVLNSALVSLTLVREAKREVIFALAVSFVMHLGNMLYFLFLSRQLGNPGATVVDATLVFPVGMLSLVLPVSISGLGVGHVMFNELFSIVGLKHGANVFNVYIVGQIAPCILGALPYVLMRKKLPQEAESSPQETKI